VVVFALHLVGLLLVVLVKFSAGRPWWMRSSRSSPRVRGPSRDQLIGRSAAAR
jgi:hypothetical protein